MKRSNLIFIVALLFSFLVTTIPVFSQPGKVRVSLKAGVSQTLGVDTEIKIVYSRPGVKGRKIWGDLVPYGMAPGNKYSKDKPYPWRAGANENTTIEFNKDILIEGQKLPAGKYGIHMIPGEKEWTIIFSKNNSAWGSFSYNQEEDALRVKVVPEEVPFQEWLSFGFDELAGTSATAFLRWEKLRVPFKIKLAE
ncbi:DUF2911 domain-containing protein [candidate division KSB1 bacterium]|nr:DUF2911 domain-containing protein [candidate division KSB1 bacterium]